MSERIFLGLLAIVALPSAAHASGASQIPEASSAVLFALGAIGVIIGRHASSRRRNRKD